MYVGLWECLVISIVDIINQCKAPTTDAMVVAVAIFKIIFFEVPLIIGFWVFMFGLTSACSIIFIDDSRRFR